MRLHICQISIIMPLMRHGDNMITRQTMKKPMVKNNCWKHKCGSNSHRNFSVESTLVKTVLLSHILWGKIIKLIIMMVKDGVQLNN